MTALLVITGASALGAAPVDAAAPPAPTLTATLVNTNQAKLTWTAVSGATSYTVLGRNATTTYSDTQYNTSLYTGTATSYTFTQGQIANDLYKWQVYANPGGSTIRSNAVYLNTAGVWQPGVSGLGSWNLRFDDEFNGPALDTVNWVPYWFYDGNTQQNGSPSGSIQDAKNVSFTNGGAANGYLQLTVPTAGHGATVSANPNGSDTRSGKKDPNYLGYQHTYGYTEMRMCLPSSTGNGVIDDWPAGWEDSQNWPTTGEHDIVEADSTPGWHVHYQDDSTTQNGVPSGVWSGCHTFAADWEPNSLTFYWDNKSVGSASGGALTSAPMYPVFTYFPANMGHFVAPATVKIDYVRIWQHAGQN